MFNVNRQILFMLTLTLLSCGGGGGGGGGGGDGGGGGEPLALSEIVSLEVKNLTSLTSFPYTYELQAQQSDNPDIASATVFAQDGKEIITITAPSDYSSFTYQLTVTNVDVKGADEPIAELAVLAPTTNSIEWRTLLKEGPFQINRVTNKVEITEDAIALAGTIPNRKILVAFTVTDDKQESFSVYKAILIGETNNNTPPFVSDVISVNPNGLTAGQAQYLMTQTHDPDGDMLFSEWSVRAGSCSFEAGDKYQNTRFALLQVAADATGSCVVSVTIKDGYGEDNTFEKSFAIHAAPETLAFSYRGSNSSSRDFVLPKQTASYTVPAHYYNQAGDIQTASSLQIPDGWSCTSATCPNQQLSFTTNIQEISISNADTSITLNLLADSNNARAVLSRADLEQVSKGLAEDYYQLATIDLGGSLHQPSSRKNRWTPIGIASNPFAGQYDGQSLPIRNLRIQQLQPLPQSDDQDLPEKQAEQDDAGLFGQSEGRIRNMALQGFDVHGNDNVGGLIGQSNVGNPLLPNAKNYAIGNASGNDNVGGLIGNNDNGPINTSYARGSVYGNNNVGGLIGNNNNGSSNSYARSDVYGNNNVGGLIGNNNNSGNITNSYTTSSVSATGENISGGLVGINNGTISASYWDSTIEDSTSSHGEGKTSTEMQMQATYTSASNSDNNWDFDSIWGINDSSNSGYPYLRCVGIGRQDCP